MLYIYEDYFKELLTIMENSEQELPNVLEGEVKLNEIVDAEVDRTMKKTKSGRATGIDEATNGNA